MILPTVLKIIFGTLYVLWVIALFASMPPEGIVETVGVLILAAMIFVAAYYFHLVILRWLINLFRSAPEAKQKMSKRTYFLGLSFVGACMLGTLFCLIMVLFGLMGLPSDRQTSVSGLTEMLLVGGIFVVAWTAAYRFSNRKPPGPGV